MTKKAEPTDEEKLAGAVRSSAQQIWQAGLGAFARAQEEGGKVFSRLVKESAEGGGDKAADAAGAWDKLEQVFEERVARALEKLGLPTRDDVTALRLQVAELTAQVAALTTVRTDAPAPAPVKKAASVKKTVPVKKAAPAEQAAPVKQATLVKQAAPVKKAPVKKTAVAKAAAAAPVKKPKAKRGAAGTP